MKQLFLGDIHGNWDELYRALRRFDLIPGWQRLYQVGDFGLGNTLVDLSTGKPFADPAQFDDRVKFIRGNHDDPKVCALYPNYLGDYGIDPETGVFFVSGAWSMDRPTQEVRGTWWDEEELSYTTLQKVIDLYREVRPSVVLSHTCPKFLADHFAWEGSAYRGSRTDNALEFMWRSHRPKLWVFGHWHKVFDKEIEGTRFVCCAINQAKLLDMPT